VFIPIVKLRSQFLENFRCKDSVHWQAVNLYNPSVFNCLTDWRIYSLFRYTLLWTRNTRPLMVSRLSKTAMKLARYQSLLLMQRIFNIYSSWATVKKKKPKSVYSQRNYVRNVHEHQQKKFTSLAKRQQVSQHQSEVFNTLMYKVIHINRDDYTSIDAFLLVFCFE
jgi:hypothetical protein